MLIAFLLRTILSETIKLSGASRRHVALHPAAISTPARSFHREYANNVAFERDAGFRIADTGYRDLHLVEEVANQFPQIGRTPMYRSTSPAELCIRLHAILCLLWRNPPTYFELGCEPLGEMGYWQNGCNRRSWQRLESSVGEMAGFKKALSQNSGRPPPADVLLWTLADLVIEPKSRLCAVSGRFGEVAFWHIASFRCDTGFGRYRGMADIDQAAPIKLDL